VLVALLGHSLRHNIAEPLEAESLALTLVQRALGPPHYARSGRQCRTAAARGSGKARADERSGAPLDVGRDRHRSALLSVYLTQVFQQVEGLPLYRYQLRLRLARALIFSRGMTT